MVERFPEEVKYYIEMLMGLTFFIGPPSCIQYLQESVPDYPGQFWMWEWCFCCLILADLNFEATHLSKTVLLSVSISALLSLLNAMKDLPHLYGEVLHCSIKWSIRLWTKSFGFQIDNEVLKVLNRMFSNQESMGQFIADGVVERWWRICFSSHSDLVERKFWTTWLIVLRPSRTPFGICSNLFARRSIESAIQCSTTLTGMQEHHW